jgi:hypothetical protein
LWLYAVRHLRLIKYIQCTATGFIAALPFGILCIHDIQRLKRPLKQMARNRHCILARSIAIDSFQIVHRPTPR